MPGFDLVLKGGTVIDGLRTPRYRADVGVVDGRIARIGRIEASEGARVLDAAGLIVAPGFVDLHTHYDSQIFWDPWCTISGHHGVTSVVIGNCGFSFAPCRPADRERAMLAMSRNEAVPMETMRAGMPWDWESFPEYLNSLERTPKALNVMSYIGLQPIYSYVMGGVDQAKERPASEEEMARMCQILIEAMDAGACGFTTQLMGANGVQRDYDGTPMITDTRGLDELAAFARAMGSTGRGFFQLTGTLEAAELVARESDRPVLFNVVTTRSTGQDQHGQPLITMRPAMDFIDRVNADGFRMYAQTITVPNETRFTLEDYNLFDSSPLWREATLGSIEERLTKLSDPRRRAALKADFDANFAVSALASAGPAAIPRFRVLRVPDDAPEEFRRLEGRVIGEIAGLEHRHPIDVLLDVSCGTRLQAEFLTLTGRPDTEAELAKMKELVTYKYGVPGVSDGGAHTKFFTLGSYPTQYLAEWVRDHEMIDLEEAHWRLSAYPASIAGIRDRGFLREGMPADIVVYDLEQLAELPSERAYDFPGGRWRLVKEAQGYRYTIVNGEVTLEDGEPTGAVPGRLLRHGADLDYLGTSS